MGSVFIFISCTACEMDMDQYEVDSLRYGNVMLFNFDGSESAAEVIRCVGWGVRMFFNGELGGVRNEVGHGLFNYETPRLYFTGWCITNLRLVNVGRVYVRRRRVPIILNVTHTNQRQFRNRLPKRENHRQWFHRLKRFICTWASECTKLPVCSSFNNKSSSSSSSWMIQGIGSRDLRESDRLVRCVKFIGQSRMTHSLSKIIINFKVGPLAYSIQNFNFW